jgi:carbonic anhydrase
LVLVEDKKDIFEHYIGTPISLLLEYHNLLRKFDDYQEAKLLIGMCMDNRKHLNIPDNFAYIIRSGGGNLRYSEFKVSYSIAIGNVKAIALIAHNNCGMVNLISQKQKFIDGLVNIAGWDRQLAEDHFMNYSPMFEIVNEIDFVLSEAKRLRQRYSKILVAPLFYNIEDNLLYLIREN